MSDGCQASTRKRIAGEGKSFDCGYPPGLRLGVKRQEPAFWANRRKSSLTMGCFFFCRIIAFGKGVFMEKRARIYFKLILTVLLSVLFIWLIHTDEKVIKKQLTQPQGELIQARDVLTLIRELTDAAGEAVNGEISGTSPGELPGETPGKIPGGMSGEPLREWTESFPAGEESSPYFTYGDYLNLLRMLVGGEEDGTFQALTYGDKYEEDFFLLKSDWYQSFGRVLALYGLTDVIQETEVSILCGNQNLAGQESLGEGCLLSRDARVYTDVSGAFQELQFTTVRAYVRENRLLTLVAALPDESLLSNVWIMEAGEDGIQFFYEGYEILAQGSGLGDPAQLREQVGDIRFKEGAVSDIALKRERVGGKLLGVAGDQIELEGHGSIPLSENCLGYQLYGELRRVEPGEMAIGYDFTDFVLDEGKVCAFLLTRRESMESIRVAIKSDDFRGLYHDKLTFRCEDDMILTYGEYEDRKQEIIAAGEELDLEAESDFFSGGRVLLAPAAASGRIQVLSHRRSQGIPQYRGKMEIVKTGEGLALINEVLLEEYLYSVVASEMPAHYPLEALKAQAVCARTYGYRYLEHPGYGSLGAHVDDSDGYQVYNNKAENVNSTKAVKETAGVLLLYGEDPVSTYYYSTSCGYGADAGIWDEEKKDAFPYLSAGYIAREQESEENAPDGAEGDTDDNGIRYSPADLALEENFREYISRTDENAYEKDETWFRWSYQVEELDEGLLYEKLAQRYGAASSKILTFTGEGDPAEPDGLFESLPPEKFRKVYEIRCLKRKEGGVLDELLIETDQGSYKVVSEYNIRYVLNQGGEAQGQGDVSRAATLLPSAYLIIDTVKSGENVIGYTIMGGGYGHGVGLSQNGAKAMGLEGLTCERILSFYYRDCQLGTIY